MEFSAATNYNAMINDQLFRSDQEEDKVYQVAMKLIAPGPIYSFSISFPYEMWWWKGWERDSGVCT